MLDWKQLVHLTDAELAKYDIAEVNLACAAGFPGFEKQQHDACIGRLNHYARCTEHYTQKRMPEFREKPEFYDNSEPIFRIVSMASLLQQVFELRYNPARNPWKCL
jgi:hypothetical protein